MESSDLFLIHEHNRIYSIKLASVSTVHQNKE
jgi:hypothetical protein